MIEQYDGIPDVDYPADGLDFFDQLEKRGGMTPKFKVLAYLFRHANPDDGMLNATYKDIQAETGVSRPTIASFLKKLEDGGAVRRVRNGKWCVEMCICPEDYDGLYFFVRRQRGDR